MRFIATVIVEVEAASADAAGELVVVAVRAGVDDAEGIVSAYVESVLEDTAAEDAFPLVGGAMPRVPSGYERGANA